MMMENENDYSKRVDEILKNEEESGKGKKSQADKIIELIEREECVLFHDQFNEPYAQVPINGHRETWKLKSKQFRRWLSSKCWELEGKTPHTNAIADAINTLEGKASFKGNKHVLENRVTLSNDAIWYDLSNENWQAVKITAEGWEIVDNPPILFKRYAHQQSQVLPAKVDGNVRGFLPFVNLAKKEQADLLLVYLVTCFIPEIPHPIPIIYGPQGAAKTTLARMLRSLIDPSTIAVLSMPTINNDLVQLISHHWFAFFDNVTFMPDWTSDALCRAVTGEGFSKRELYSDDDDIILAFRRCIGLNGINLAAKKPDLLDRGILFKLDRISSEQRKGEKEIWNEFEEARPRILGGVFDALSKAMKLRKDIKLEHLPRMADFALWGSAIAQAIGSTQDDFIGVYSANINTQHDEAIHENVVASVLMTFMENRETWDGTPSDLYNELNNVAENENLNSLGSGWPRSAAILSRRINEVKTNLYEKGVLVESFTGSNNKRLITIKKIPKNGDTGATDKSSFEIASEIFNEKSVEEENGSNGDSGDTFGLPF